MHWKAQIGPKLMLIQNLSSWGQFELSSAFWVIINQKWLNTTDSQILLLLPCILLLAFIFVFLLSIDFTLHPAAKHHILTYLEDAVEQLLEYKDDNPKVNTTRFFFD